MVFCCWLKSVFCCLSKLVFVAGQNWYFVACARTCWKSISDCKQQSKQLRDGWNLSILNYFKCGLWMEAWMHFKIMKKWTNFLSVKIFSINEKYFLLIKQMFYQYNRFSIDRTDFLSQEQIFYQFFYRKDRFSTNRRDFLSILPIFQKCIFQKCIFQ